VHLIVQGHVLGEEDSLGDVVENPVEVRVSVVEGLLSERFWLGLYRLEVS
jgi:hypothetical protein